MLICYFETSQVGVSGRRKTQRKGIKGKVKPGIVASLHGKRYPTTNIRNVPPFQQRQLNINRWPRSFGTDISLRYIVLIGVIRPSPRPVTPLDTY